MAKTRMQLENWLDDLCVRFIINLPQEDLSSVARICFQVEEAQWFYEDFIRPLDPSLPSMSLRSFCLRIFQHCPLLSEFSNDNHMRAFEEFLAYKTRVPVRGAIMLNHEMDSVVLVKGWKKGANWSFPRGKINKDEDDLDCAVREVYEETGYDIRAAGLVPEAEEVKHIEITMREQHMRLYVFRDVPMDTHFEPRTRKEISKIEWYRLSDLPAFRKKGQQQTQDNAHAAVNANKFYMVAPFLVPLKKWVAQQKKKDAQRPVNNQFLAPPYMDDVITEEETGTDRNPYITQSESESKPITTPGLDTLEGATAALHRLLKIQPPTQGLQPASALQSPATKDNGEALLALLQGKAKDETYLSNAPRTSQSHSPLDHIVTTPLPKTTQHHNHPQNPDQPLSLQSSQASNSYQPRLQPEQFMHNQSGLPGIPQHYHSQFPPPQQPQNFAHRPDQQQQLQHPQPLPPQVQRAVFNGFQPHAPLVSQNMAIQPDSRFPQEVISTIQNPQFPNIHVPIISPSMNHEPPRLTSHSLALLNAFKSRDHAESSGDHPSDFPLHRFSNAVEAPSTPLENLPGRNNPAEMSGDDMAPPPIHLPPARSAPSDQHRSSLLNIFKMPTSKATQANGVPTLPQSIIHIPKSDHLFSPSNSLAPSYGLPAAQNVQPTKKTLQAPKANSPFRPVSILTRPPQQSVPVGPPSAELETPKGRLNDRSRPSASPKRSQAESQRQSNHATIFQPQILRRPQPSDPPLPTELAAPTPPALAGFPIPSMLSRQPPPPSGHKQNLLSLFGKAPPIPMPPLSDQPGVRPFDSTSVAGRSRVGSLASTAGETVTAGRRGSQTPTSPANTAFLLGYLDGITKSNGVQK